MAIVCPSHRLLFIQAPRTGCTAIQTLLLNRFGGEFLPKADVLDSDGFVRVQKKHCTIDQLLDLKLVPAQYNDVFTTFTTIRNPFDSLVSLYVKKRDSNQPRLQDPTSWVHKVRGYKEDMEFCRTHTFEEWLIKRYDVSRVDRLLGKGRRSLYGRYTNGMRVVMKFEQLQRDFESVMRGAGVVGDVTIPSINTTVQRTGSFRDYYTTRARQIVEYAFKEELDRYGYSFEASDESHARAVPAEPVR